MRLRQRRKVDLPQPDGGDQGDRLAVANIEIDVAQSVIGSVIDVDIPRRHLGGDIGRRRRLDDLDGC